MPGGRPPTPLKLLKLNGGYRPERHDGRGAEPEPEGEAAALAELTGDALAMWNHLVPQLKVMGLATDVDSAELTALCEWWAEYRKWVNDTNENAYRRIVGAATAYKQFNAIGSKFGLSPVDRAKLGASVETPDDLVDKYLA